MLSDTITRSRSSEGRGGNTQKEHYTLSAFQDERKTETQPWGETKSKARRKGDPRSSQNQRGSSGKDWRTGVAQSVKGALEEIFAKTNPQSWEKQLLDIVDLYDDKANRERIFAYRRTIAGLQERLQSRVDPQGTRMVLRWTLRSYKKRLQEAQGTLTSTPASSEDEDADESSEDEWEDDPNVTPNRISEESHGKVDETNTVETKKTFKKITKVLQVTPEEDETPYRIKEKNHITPKTQKKDAMLSHGG